MFHSYLFGRIKIDDYMNDIRIKLESEIEGMSDAELNQDLNEMCDYFVEKHRIDVPVLKEEYTADAPLDNPYARSVKLKCYIPFEGDAKLFDVAATSHPVICTPCQVEGQHLTVEVEVHLEYPDLFRDEMRQFITTVNDGLNTLREQTLRWAKHIPEWATQTINKRKTALTRQEQFQQRLSELVPLRRRDDGTEKIIVPVQRKPAPLPPAMKSPMEPELPISSYDDILNIIQAMVHVFERSPTVFKQMGEEDLHNPACRPKRPV